MPERQFSEDQVAEIIRNAAEHMAVLGRNNPRSVGVSESELRRIAAELGIEHGALQRALDQVGVWRSHDRGTLQSVERVLVRTFDEEIPDDSLSVLAEEFVPVPMGAAGLKIGNTVSYSSMAGMAQCTVNVSRTTDQTKIRVRSNAFVAVMATLFPAFMLTFITGAIVFDGMSASMLAKSVIFGVASILLWTGAIMGFRAIVRHTNRKIAGLLDRTCAALAESKERLRRNLARAHAPESLKESSEAHVDQA